MGAATTSLRRLELAICHSGVAGSYCVRSRSSQPRSQPRSFQSRSQPAPLRVLHPRVLRRLTLAEVGHDGYATGTVNPVLLKAWEQVIMKRCKTSVRSYSPNMSILEHHRVNPIRQYTNNTSHHRSVAVSLSFSVFEFVFESFVGMHISIGSSGSRCVLCIIDWIASISIFE